eukprot:s590_g36.t1
MILSQNDSAKLQRRFRRTWQTMPTAFLKALVFRRMVCHMLFRDEMLPVTQYHTTYKIYQPSGGRAARSAATRRRRSGQSSEEACRRGLCPWSPAGEDRRRATRLRGLHLPSPPPGPRDDAGSRVFATGTSTRVVIDFCAAFRAPEVEEGVFGAKAFDFCATASLARPSRKTSFGQEWHHVQEATQEGLRPHSEASTPGLSWRSGVRAQSSKKRS